MKLIETIKEWWIKCKLIDEYTEEWKHNNPYSGIPKPKLSYHNCRIATMKFSKSEWNALPEYVKRQVHAARAGLPHGTHNYLTEIMKRRMYETRGTYNHEMNCYRRAYNEWLKEAKKYANDKMYSDN